MAVKIKWRGQEVLETSIEHLEPIMSDIALAAEGNSKKELYKGHGVLTGTLRRSVHAASPGYNWSSDTGASELGGQQVTPERRGGRLVVELGSGLSYALAIHQGWSGPPFRGSFSGYHYITNGVEKTHGQVPGIVARHRIK